jgi:hypothetical protein
MNILNLSIQLRELSNEYSSQKIVFNEYRLKRKCLFDEIDQTLNQQLCETTPSGVEKADESAHEGDVISRPIFDADKTNDNAADHNPLPPGRED